MDFFDEEDGASQNRESFFTQAATAPPRAGPSRYEPDLDLGNTEQTYDEDDQLPPRIRGLRDSSVGELEIEGEQDDNVVVRLARRWMDERSSPELLHADPNGDLDLCLQTLLRQVRVLLFLPLLLYGRAEIGEASKKRSTN